jgi:hypothetical protein
MDNQVRRMSILFLESGPIKGRMILEAQIVMKSSSCSQPIDIVRIKVSK